MEKHCPNCNRSNPSDAAFCRHCASPLPAGAGGGQPFANPQPNQQQNQQWNPPPPAPGGNPQTNFAPAGNSDGASGRAIGSVALAAGGLLLCCFPAGIGGAILGWLELTAIREGRASPKGTLMAQIGLWGGIGGAVLSLVFVVLYMLMAMMGGGYGY